VTASILDWKSVEGALLRYRIVALIVSVLLVILFFIGLPLHSRGIDAVVGTAHGVFFYPLYILLTLDLTRRVRMTPVQLVLTILAGTIPIASFYAERKTTEYVRHRIAAMSTPLSKQAEPDPAPPTGRAAGQPAE
jgi:integral membrane protein